MRGNIMARKAKGTAKYFLVFFVLSLMATPAFLGAYEKKVQVVVDYTHVYFNPDDASSVIDTLERGAVLSLLYSGKTKKVWYYVCYKSEKTGITKSGYVLDSTVEPLFDALKTIVIAEETEGLKVNYAPRKFGEMTWGQSKKQVVESEGRPLYQEKIKGLDIMEYQQKVNNLDCSIRYIFAANKLSQTRFIFMNNYSDKNTYLEDYQKIKDFLIQKFGRPLEESMNWRDTTYKDDFAAWGEAIGQGQLELSSRWQTPHTEILANLSGNNKEIALTVEYTGLDLKKLAKRSQEE
jgi:hypothetical protein